MNLIVLISNVSDGNMYIPTDKSNQKVIDNRTTFLAKNGIDINQTNRVSFTYDKDDFCIYEEVTNTELGDGMFDGGSIAADGLVTRNVNHAIFLSIADCVGTVIFDPAKNVLMVTHLGRHNLEQNGGYKSVKFLIDNYGCDPSQLKIWLTPAPGVQSYPLFSFNNRSLKDVVFEQLQTAGILLENITDNKADTSTDLNYYSHSEFLKGNRDEDGRFAIVGMMSDKH